MPCPPAERCPRRPEAVAKALTTSIDRERDPDFDLSKTYTDRFVKPRNSRIDTDRKAQQPSAKDRHRQRPPYPPDLRANRCLLMAHVVFAEAEADVAEIWLYMGTANGSMDIADRRHRLDHRSGCGRFMLMTDSARMWITQGSKVRSLSWWLIPEGRPSCEGPSLVDRLEAGRTPGN